MKIVEEIKFDEKGLVPAIAQDVKTKKVLMLAYMNKESLEKTLKTKKAHYFSRSRQKLWMKGETSGNVQYLEDIRYDCDADTILLLVNQKGPACHTGKYSCFFRDELGEEIDVAKDEGTVNELYKLIQERKEKPQEGSYTCYLFEKGIDKILKKVGEEAAEVIIGAKNNDKENTVYEIADLTYHLLVMMVEQGITPDEILKELEKRRK